MAGRNRQPVAVIVAKGKTHLTRDEKERREAEETTVPPEYRDVEIPEYLLQWPDLVSTFDRYVEMLRALLKNNFGQPDADCLARYVVSEHLYESFTTKLVSLEKPNDIKTLQIAQDRAFRQAHTCASALGLTVTSRCKLVVPSGADGDGNDESEF